MSYLDNASRYSVRLVARLVVCDLRELFEIRGIRAIPKGRGFIVQCDADRYAIVRPEPRNPGGVSVVVFVDGEFADISSDYTIEECNANYRTRELVDEAVHCGAQGAWEARAFNWGRR
jgi:hypothetical protein